MADEDTDRAEGSGALEEFHEIAEGFHDLGEGTSGRLTIPGSPRLPSGQVLLRDAIRRFCADREGKPADNVDLPRFQELIDPIRTALLDGQIKVTCLTREAGRATVSGDAFVDEKTWWAIVYAPGSIPIRPKVGIEDGHLLVVQADFDTVTLEQVDGASAPSQGASTAPGRGRRSRRRPRVPSVAPRRPSGTSGQARPSALAACRTGVDRADRGLGLAHIGADRARLSSETVH